MPEGGGTERTGNSHRELVLCVAFADMGDDLNIVLIYEILKEKIKA